MPDVGSIFSRFGAFEQQIPFEKLEKALNIIYLELPLTFGKMFKAISLFSVCAITKV